MPRPRRDNESLASPLGILRSKLSVSIARRLSVWAGLVLAATSCSQKDGRRQEIIARDSLQFVDATNGSVPSPGAFLIPKLTGEAATNHAQRLERLRHLPKQAGFEARVLPKSAGQTSALRYLLFKPKVEAQTSYPLVLSLHGGGPRRRFEDLLEPYAPGFAYGLGRLVAPETQQAHPCFVVAPWSDGRGWDDDNLAAVVALLDRLQADFKVDPARLYVTGQSMGGYGTWSMITRHPQRFAAAIPICGGGDPPKAHLASAIPIWAFHGSADKVVPVGETRDMVRALWEAGGRPVYWEYTGATHADTAERAYGEPGLMDWLFAQRKAESAP